MIRTQICCFHTVTQNFVLCIHRLDCCLHKKNPKCSGVLFFSLCLRAKQMLCSASRVRSCWPSAWIRKFRNPTCSRYLTCLVWSTRASSNLRIFIKSLEEWVLSNDLWQVTKEFQNAFNVTMDPSNNISTLASCTTCTFSEDFSNYWTAVLYFKARNGTYKRVPQKGNVGFEAANGGGMTGKSRNQPDLG